MSKVWIEVDVDDIEVSGSYERGKVKLKFKADSVDVAKQIDTNEVIEAIGKEAAMEYWGLIEKDDAQ